MGGYFSKSEQEPSEALRQAEREIKNQKMKTRDSIYARQISVQEVAYLSLPELWLRKLLSSVLYVKTNTLSKRVSMLKSKKEITELPEDSNEIFKSGFLEYYMMRLKQNDVINIYFAVFTYYYFKPVRKLKMTISQIVLILIQQ